MNATSARVLRALDGAETYLRGRQSPSGGFCFYRSALLEEPNLGDTYHAVAALTRLRRRTPQAAKIADFVSRAALYGPSYYYFQWLTLDLLGQIARIPQVARHAIAKLTVTVPDREHTETTTWLERTRQVLCLRQALGDSDKHPDVLRFLQSHRAGGGFGDAPNLWNTWQALAILAILGRLADATDTAAFVNSLQRRPDGFTMTPCSSAAYPDTVYAGVMCCASLEVPIRYPGDIVEFTLSCQTAEGGFARASTGLPDIQRTYWAAEVLTRVAPTLP